MADLIRKLGNVECDCCAMYEDERPKIVQYMKKIVQHML